MYNYLEAIKADVKDAINNNYDLNDYRGNRGELEEKLNDDLWTDDSVTGNASGSYTFNSYEAGEYVKDNLDLLKEAATDFFCTDRAEKWLFDEAWEDADVTIRCYLLGQAINEVLDEIEEAGELDEIEEETEEPSAELLKLASKYEKPETEPETIQTEEKINA